MELEGAYRDPCKPYKGLTETLSPNKLEGILSPKLAPLFPNFHGGRRRRTGRHVHGALIGVQESRLFSPNLAGSRLTSAASAQGDMFTVHSVACLSREWSATSRLLFYTLTPVLLVLVLAVPILFASALYAARRKADSDEFKRLTARFFNAVRWMRRRGCSGEIWLRLADAVRYAV
jgi:hypothetical protein